MTNWGLITRASRFKAEIVSFSAGKIKFFEVARRKDL